MNQISLIGIIFGLILLSFLSFTAGFITSYVMVSQGGSSYGATVSVASNPPASVMPSGGEPGAPSGAPQDSAADASGASAPDSAASAALSPEATMAVQIEEQSEKTASARIPTEGDAGKFSVKLKTVGDRVSAVQMMATLRRLGYGVYAVRSQMQSSSSITRIIYDLRVGVFEDYVAANQFAYKLRLIGHRMATVTVIPNNLKIVVNLND
ncbi:MAG: hypothetical protein H6849_01075 [Alphaproteobacteria bacterium]|nr:MAG: hypothetical protein H6849_01075 [Alphaproteobacteria bacterium]